jgi:hypothetical protein
MTTARKLDHIDHVDTASTVRIDRRQTVLAQLEAALLADKISVMELPQEATGTDPYNSFRPTTNVWSKPARWSSLARSGGPVNPPYQQHSGHQCRLGRHAPACLPQLANESSHRRGRQQHCPANRPQQWQVFPPQPILIFRHQQEHCHCHQQPGQQCYRRTHHDSDQCHQRLHSA